MIAEYANGVGASTVVIGARTHGGLPALIDGSSSRELLRLAHSDVLIINPAAPAHSDPPLAAEPAGAL
jgi:nucleotide-binding universal stress UspA family protein